MSTQTADHVISPVGPPSLFPLAIPTDVLRTAERLGVAEQLPQVLALSREVFGGPIALRVAEDPELDDWTHIVVETTARGMVHEIVAQEEAWCDLMARRHLSHWFTLATESE